MDYTQFSGPWAAGLVSGDGFWSSGVALHPPDGRPEYVEMPTWLRDRDQDSDPPAEWLLPYDDDDSSGTRRSVWTPREMDSVEAWEYEVDDLPQSEVLLAGDDGRALVYRLTNDYFDGSQIVIVNNGAPLLNGSLVDRPHREIGERLIELCMPAKRVALLTYDERGLLITSIDEREQNQSGLEMLTVWPLSGITMSAALLGIVVCAALLPILGRPRPLRRDAVSDFGLHVEAIGDLMREAADAGHAKSAIAEYYTKVRGESPPPWAK